MSERTCSIDGCAKPHEARGWCPAHYRRWRATGDPQGSRVRKYKARPRCAVETCEKPNYGHGFCQTHYWRWKRHGDPLGERKGSPGQTRLCVHCADQYNPRRSEQRFCGRRCASAFRQTDDYKELLAQEMKRCTKCGEVKGRDQFYRASRSPSGLAPWCKGCRALRSAELNTRPEVKEQMRANKLLAKYGMTITDFERLLAAQGHQCRICDRPHGENGKQLVVDHCHATGRVRGLLCGLCNTALGHFEDDPERMAKAIAYIKG